MALIVITVQDGENGVAVGVQNEPPLPALLEGMQATPAHQLAARMLRIAQEPGDATNASPIVLLN